MINWKWKNSAILPYQFKNKNKLFKVAYDFENNDEVFHLRASRFLAVNAKQSKITQNTCDDGQCTDNDNERKTSDLFSFM